MDLQRALGLLPGGGEAPVARDHLHRELHVQLTSLGAKSQAGDGGDGDALLVRYQEQRRLLAGTLCPIDARIQTFLDQSLAVHGAVPRLPDDVLVLDRHGLARAASLPEHGDHHQSAILDSYRLANGVLHNPANDRRTTEGSFHVAEGGLPIADDKKAVPAATFLRLLDAALHPPEDLLLLPFTRDWVSPARRFVALHLRPLVRPAVPGISPEQRMELRAFAPGSLASNLDFIESIFGNAGDPSLPENDAGLDALHWSGHTGCIIFATHLTALTKKELGLPPLADATPRQRRDGMCWSDPTERYNGGNAFKVTHRTAAGVMVTLIADNYFGYGKKEVKTQISFAANLLGSAEEEHAGGCLAFPSYNNGDQFLSDSTIGQGNHTLQDALALLGGAAERLPEGHARLLVDPSIVLLPEDAHLDVVKQTVTWDTEDGTQTIPLRIDVEYFHPSGWRVHADRHPEAPSWRLVSTSPVATFCHKPCTVSGGGKSEISKRLDDAVHYGPIIVGDLAKDLDQVQKILDGDYSHRLLSQFRHDYSKRPSRPVLSSERTLGSVIKLFTPNDQFTPEYNAWLESVPAHIWPLVFTVKRFYKEDWGTQWRQHFTVDSINGRPGFQLLLKNRPIVASYLRVGTAPDGAWRRFKLRQDFLPAAKVQTEDDITASTVVPAAWLGLSGPSRKLAENCEARLFQRPDDAVHRGYDKVTEKEMADPGLFCSNWQPLDGAAVLSESDDFIRFDRYTEPMQQHLELALKRSDPWTISSARPRIVGGKPSKNPRYLQLRPDLANPRPKRLATLAVRLNRRIPADQAVTLPVDAILSGRRNNPPEPGSRALCVYNPLHWQELPELMMDYLSSLTGKSPSTTGAGSEGALTKGPFNALLPAADLNSCLIGMILTGYDGFSSPANAIGPRGRVDHDVSLLVPELWCRLTPEERDARTMIAHGHLERVEDRTVLGKTIRASRLGWRITQAFVHDFFGRIFDNGTAVFDASLLKPELQDEAVFADGVDNIVGAQTTAAKLWLADGSVDDACPPLSALIRILAEGEWQGKDEHDPAFRALFTRESLLASDWYAQRIELQQRLDIHQAAERVAALERFLARPSHHGEAQRLALPARLDAARARLAQVSDAGWRQRLVGTVGAEPSLHR